MGIELQPEPKYANQEVRPIQLQETWFWVDMLILFPAHKDPWDL